jgi:hypothetical protein
VIDPVAQSAEGGEALAVHVGGYVVGGFVVVVVADHGLGGVGAVEAALTPGGERRPECVRLSPGEGQKRHQPGRPPGVICRE